MKPQKITSPPGEKNENPGAIENAPPTCPHCGGSKIIENNGLGETVCASCGFVIRNKTFVAYPPRVDSDGDGVGELTGVGSPENPSLHDKGLSTEISPKDVDGRGNPLSPKEKALARKLRSWQKRCRVSGDGERNLAIALREIDRVASQLGIPRSVRRIASRIYRRAADEGLVATRSIEAVSSAAVYAACKNSHLPKTQDEIADLTNVGGKKIRQAYRSLIRNLDLNLPPIDPVSHMRKFGDRLNLSKRTNSEAADVVREARERGLVSGRSPTATAIAALYLTSSLNGEEITQEGVEEVTNVSRKTVSERHRQIAEGLDIDVRFQSWKLESFATD